MFKQHMTIGGSLGIWFGVIGVVTLGIGILVLTQVGALISVSPGEIAAAVNEIQRWIVVALALIFVLGGAFAYIFTRGITKPLGEAVKITSGDLRSEIEVKSRDETGQLLHALKNMNQNLGQIVRDVRHNAESMLTSVKEIAIGNLDLSQRTEEQASSLEETASSMEQLAAAMKGNVEDSKHINKLATGTSEVATNGAQIVESVVATMAAINESSKKIVDIIGVIEGIAFQTNILALNAAVEAARAGEQGRGFAVVASEVRNLAQRSAQAAKEIKALIGDSVDKIKNGAKLAEDAGQAMDDINVSIGMVVQFMADISASVVEQTGGVEQVNQALTQMDEITQQNAALVEQAAASVASLEDQAHALHRSVSVFKLSDSDNDSLEELREAFKSNAPRVESKSFASARPSHTARPAVKNRGEARPISSATARPKSIARKSIEGDEDGDWKEF